MYVSSPAKLARPISDAYNTNSISILLTEERHRSKFLRFILRHDFSSYSEVVQKKGVDSRLDIIGLEVEDLGHDLTAIGLAIILKMCGVTNLATGLVVTFQIWFFLILSTRLYSFVYSPERPSLLIMDSIHLLLGFLAAGAVISAWA